jgi:hypothetical protein
LNLYVITQRDPVFIDLFFENLDVSNFENVYIFNAPNFGGGKWTGFKKFVSLFGLMSTVFSTFRALFLPPKIPSKCQIRSDSWRAIERDIIDSLPVFSQDVLLSVSAPHKISGDVLELFNKKLNLHGGELPKYAGMMPLFWQLYHGLSHYTLTLHELAEEIDSGEIIFEALFPYKRSLLSTMRSNKEYSALIFNLYMQGKLKLSPRAQNAGNDFNKYPDAVTVKDFRRNFK